MTSPQDTPMVDQPPADQSRPPIKLLPQEGRDRLNRSVPAPLTSFIGREREAQAIIDLLQRTSVRLLTLTGPGGVGKTRLALLLADELTQEFPAGVAFVQLAPISESSFVLSAIAQSLSIRDAGGRPLIEVIESHLRDRRLLLILDNFEHVVDAAPVVTALLSACPDLTVLATSRIALRVQGEHEFAVPPLTLPDLDHLPPVAELEQNEAVALFVERTRAVRPSFVLTPEIAGTVVQICQRLDGLPLAIELAAAHSKVLSPPALAARLGNRLELLTSGPKDVPARLQTMRSTIDWSYGLLTEEERRLFRRLAVFSGSFTLEAAEYVGADPELTEAEGGSLSLNPNAGNPVFEQFTSLIDKSLLLHLNSSDDEQRFRMLQTIREYGLEQLDLAGEADLTQQRHAGWYLTLAEARSPDFQSRSNVTEALNQFAAEHDNLRAALGWFDRTGDIERLQRLAGANFLFWYVHGHLHEGLYWIERALAHGGVTPNPVRARILLAAGMLAHYAGDDDRAVPRLEESLELYRTIADRWGLTFTLTILGIVAEDAGQYSRAAALLAESLVHAKEAEDPIEIGLVLFHLGVVAWGEGDRQRAAALMREALAVQRAAGDLAYGAAESLTYLGLLACEAGDILHSVELQRESLSLQLELGSRENFAVNLANVAMLAVATQRPRTAIELFAAAMWNREAIGNPFKLPERTVYERAIEATRSLMPEAQFAEAWDAGVKRSLPHLIADVSAALDDIGGHVQDVALTPGPAAAGKAPSLITDRELDVLRLLVEGLSDREIADALYISPRTAQGHVAHIFTKLNVRTRSAAVATAIRSGLVPTEPGAS